MHACTQAIAHVRTKWAHGLAHAPKLVCTQANMRARVHVSMQTTRHARTQAQSRAQTCVHTARMRALPLAHQACAFACSVPRAVAHTSLFTHDDCHPTQGRSHAGTDVVTLAGMRARTNSSKHLRRHSHARIVRTTAHVCFRSRRKCQYDTIPYVKRH